MLSVPWLNRSLADPRQSGWILYSTGQSFDDEAMAIFDADMKAMGKEHLLEEVRAVRDQVALIRIEDAFWLVLPDKRMVLWRFDTFPKAGLLKWTRADLRTIERLDAWANWRNCAGAVVSTEGDLVP